jgi:hypothetical protein
MQHSFSNLSDARQAVVEQAESQAITPENFELVVRLATAMVWRLNIPIQSAIEEADSEARRIAARGEQ